MRARVCQRNVFLTSGKSLSENRFPECGKSLSDDFIHAACRAVSAPYVRGLPAAQAMRSLEKSRWFADSAVEAIAELVQYGCKCLLLTP